MESQIKFGKYIAQLRRESGYKSQRKLAEVSGISNGTIARIEDGSQKPKPETLNILAQYLSGVSYEMLMEKMGYIYQEEEDMEVQADVSEFIFRQLEPIIFNFSKNDDDFILEFEEFLKTYSENNNIDFEKIRNPLKLINFVKWNPDLNVKSSLHNEIFNFNSANEHLKVKKNRIMKTDRLVPNEYELENYILNHLISLDASMVGDGIISGSKVFYNNDRNLRNGDLGVIKLLASSETLIRRVEFLKDTVILISSNNSVKPLIIEIDAIEILGKVIKTTTEYA